MPIGAVDDRFSLIDWIQTHFPKDTLICRAWLNAWIIGVLRQIQYAVKQGCVRLLNALKCILEAIFTDDRVCSSASCPCKLFTTCISGLCCCWSEALPVHRVPINSCNSLLAQIQPDLADQVSTSWSVLLRRYISLKMVVHEKVC